MTTVKELCDKLASIPGDLTVALVIDGDSGDHVSQMVCSGDINVEPGEPGEILLTGEADG